MSTRIRTILASIGTTLVSVIADESGALKENEIVVRSPQAFLAMIDGSNGRPPAPPSITTRRVGAPSAKAPPRPATRKPRLRDRVQESKYYHVKARPGIDPHKLPRVGHWKLSMDEGARLEQAIRSKDNSLSDIQLYILRNHFGIDVLPLSQDDIAKELAKTFPQFVGNKGRELVKREEANGLRALGMLHRRRRRALRGAQAE